MQESTKESRGGWREAFVPAGLFLGVLLLYLRTLCPTVYMGDAGEIATASTTGFHRMPLTTVPTCGPWPNLASHAWSPRQKCQQRLYCFWRERDNFPVTEHQPLPCVDAELPELVRCDPIPVVHRDATRSCRGYGKCRL